MKKKIIGDNGEIDSEYTGKNGGGDKKMMDDYVGKKNGKPSKKKKKKKVDIEMAGKAAWVKKLGLKY